MLFRLFINDVLWLETRSSERAFTAFREASRSRRDWPNGGNVRLQFVSDRAVA